MTDQTVPVPVNMLKALIPADSNDGGSFGSTFHAVQALKALIPTDPPKVGDVIDDPEKADRLEAGTVLRDKVGDIWVVSGNGSLFYTKPRRSHLDMSPLFAPDFASYRPTIIALPED